MTTSSKSKPVGLTATICLFLAACGIEVGNPKKPDGGSGTSKTPNYLVDDEAAAQATATVVDEALLLTFETLASSEATELHLSTSVQAPTSTCSSTAEGVQVSRRRTGNRSRTQSQRNRTYDYELAFSDSATILLSTIEEEELFRCNPTGTRLRILRNDFESFDQQTSFSRDRTMTVRNAEATVVRSMEMKANGSRSLSWERLTKDDGRRAVRQTVTMELDKQVDYFSKQSLKQSLKTKISTSPESPMTIETGSVDSLTPLLDWEYKTIDVRGLTSVQKDGTSITTEFAGVVVERAAGCLPTAGVIRGTLRVPQPSGDDEVREFLMDFSSEQPAIAFDNGRAIEYLPELCELD